MPSFTYTGESDRVYPFLGLLPVPGESYDLEVAPEDDCWAAAGSSTPPVPKPFVSAPVVAATPSSMPSVTTEPTPTSTGA